MNERRLLLMPSRIVIGWSGSSSQRQGVRSIGLCCCRSVPGVGRGLRFRRCGRMGVAIVKRCRVSGAALKELAQIGVGCRLPFGG